MLLIKHVDEVEHLPSFAKAGKDLLLLIALVTILDEIVDDLGRRLADHRSIEAFVVGKFPHCCFVDQKYAITYCSRSMRKDAERENP